MEVGREKKKRRTARRGNKWSGGRGESLGCNLFCSELGKGKVDICILIYFIISDGNEKKKFILNKVVGNWSLEVGREKKKTETEDSSKVVARGDGREQKGSGVGEAVNNKKDSPFLKNTTDKTRTEQKIQTFFFSDKIRVAVK